MPQEIIELVLRFARENVSWRYDRIQGALANLGHEISDQTVGNILKSHGIEPAPERKRQATWKTFLKAHWDVLVALDVTIDGILAAGVTTETNRAMAAADGQQEKATAKRPVELTQLPAAYTETIPATQIEFSMVLVPGDTEKGISPLYVEQHEVTWNEFMPWVAGRDLKNQEDLGELRAMKLRPSPPYGSVDRGFGMDRRPALGMSRLSAELYCKWLSKQTEKTYRLPTEKQCLKSQGNPRIRKASEPGSNGLWPAR